MKLPVIVSIACGITFLLVILVGFVALPKMVNSRIRKELALKPESDIRKVYLKMPFPIDFKIYVFNVTNPREVINGESPVVDEIGPYHFQEWKEKVDVSDNETEDSLTYHNKFTWIFRKDLSAPGLTGEEMITMPHPLIVGMAVMMAKDRPNMLSFVIKAIKSIYRNPETPFLTATAMDILFRGVEIDCSVTDFAGKAVCGQFRTEVSDLEHVSGTLFKFSFFGMKNATVDPKAIKVKRGITDYRELGQVIEYDGKKEMTVWATRKCNQYVGTDSTIFPPFLKKEDGVGAFAPELCRSIMAVYDKSQDYYGIKVHRFTATLGDMSTIEEQKCYCPTSTTCWKKGVHDLTKCVGVPVVASLPHFYAGHDDYIHGVRGLHPNEKDHGIELIFESMTGTPISGKKRLQFNLPFIPIEKFEIMKNVGEFLVPLIWVEEGATLPEDFQAQLIGLFRMLRRITIVKWLMAIGSLTVMGTGIVLHYNKQFQTVDLTPLHIIKSTTTTTDNLDDNVEPIDADGIPKNGNKTQANYDKH